MPVLGGQDRAQVIVLGLDLAQSTGWALARGGEIYASGVVKLPWSKDRPGATVAEAYRRILALVESFGPLDLAALEDVQFASRRDAHASHWRVRTLWTLALADVPLVGVQTSTLKKWATGHGGATKEAMCRVASARSGLALVARDQGGSKAQEDQADAILVALWGHQFSSSRSSGP